MAAMIDPDDKRITYLPVEEALKPVNMAKAYVGYWWAQHPERGLLIWRRYSPQCNQHQVISEKLTGSLYPWADCVYHEVVYLPGRFEDTRY